MSGGTGPAGVWEELVERAVSFLHGDEVLLASFAGEHADFVRFNGAAVRQAGSVHQHQLGLDLLEGRRHATASIPLSGDTTFDRARLQATVQDLRERRRSLPEDPYVLYSNGVGRTERIRPSELPDPETVLPRIVEAGRGRDLVGLWSAGTTFRGFASSLGQRNWYEVSTFGFDWSFHLHGDRAAKNAYAGFRWSDDEFGRTVQWSERQLEGLARPRRELPPGRYRAYLAPAALAELTDLLGWGGFGLKAHRTRQTPLLRLATGDAVLHPSVRIAEDTAGGVAPDFGPEGFTRPDEVVLVDGGRLTGWLVSPRSAQEYGVPTNGASPWESPESIAVAAGTLPADEVLDLLGTGLYIGNLWYTNYSDRAAGRITGMTRFATFWVQDGRIVGPVAPLRFDDTVFRLLGERLVGLTDRVEVLLDSSSYGARSTGSSRLPGALVEEMRFTL
jgi:predicted Zn-dependent protease